MTETTIIPTTSQLSAADLWGSVKTRWAFNRMHYAVEPGLYSLGQPDGESPVFVSANYKLSFDALRKSLPGIDGYILVLDTDGINVWCAAGKGTFGTDEIVRRIEAANLSEVVTHRRIIVPQLGATGVAAHEVKKQSGFKVIYGPVRAADIPAFLAADSKASPEMRRVRFPLWDRLVLVPVELVLGLKKIILIMAAFFLLSGLSRSGYELDRALNGGLNSVLCLLTGFFLPVILGPLLLPWIPGRGFALKGVWLGIASLALCVGLDLTGDSYTTITAWGLMLIPLASYLVMNFTGASTYTSLSGVNKEMKIALPLQILSAAAGIIIWIVLLFV
jgi:hypothetical protein